MCKSYLTKAQEISLNFHCKCEQFVHFANGSFFNFNGTAGAALSLCVSPFSLLGPGLHLSVLRLTAVCHMPLHSTGPFPLLPASPASSPRRKAAGEHASMLHAGSPAEGLCHEP